MELYEQIERAAQDVRRGIQKPQRTYVRLAELIYFHSLAEGKDWKEYFSEIITEYKSKNYTIGENTGLFFDRIFRNILAIFERDIITKDRDLARQVTDNWQDYEILDNYNLTNGDVRNTLQAWYEFWLDDKQSGRLSDGNNYGAIIERRLQTTKNNKSRHVEPEETPNNALWLLKAWHAAKDMDIFKDVKEDEFLQMVKDRNFSKVYNSCGDKKNLLVSLSYIARSIYKATAQDDRVLSYLEECNKHINAATDVKNWNVNTTDDTRFANLSKKFGAAKSRKFSD